jgi:hypothetical protein
MEPLVLTIRQISGIVEFVVRHSFHSSSSLALFCVASVLEQAWVVGPSSMVGPASLVGLASVDQAFWGHFS